MSQDKLYIPHPAGTIYAMHLFSVLAALWAFIAVAGWFNERFFRLPQPILLMLSALGVSMGAFALEFVGIDLATPLSAMVTQIDFREGLLDIVLAFLLFAGALSVDLQEFLDERTPISILAFIGVALSALFIGTGVYFLIPLITGIAVPFAACVLLGALLSPTDPIATLGLLEASPNIPKNIRTHISGEALFNDGVGIVLYLTLVGVAAGAHVPSVADFVALFLREALGGLGLGLLLGLIAYRMLASIDRHIVEASITLALVMGGSAIAGWLGVSGALAMVAAGLLIGNHGRAFAMSKNTREYLDHFWEVLDGLLNAALFALIGFEVFLLDLEPAYVLIAAAMVPVVLASRFGSVWISSVASWAAGKPFRKHALGLLTWGGLRGGISFALALGLPESPYRDAMLVITFGVVAFSVIVQGLTLPRLLRYLKL